MKINGKIYPIIEAYPTMMTVPDCMVVRDNKIGRGHGEAKFYVTSKKDMYEFYGAPGFAATCFMLKSDLIAYMMAIKTEYSMPSQEYAEKDRLPVLWEERMKKVLQLDEVIYFQIFDQQQISGTRGYIKSRDEGYQIIREVALPLISYIYAEKIGDETTALYYWKLFVDFDAIWEKKNGPLVLHYGKDIRKSEKNEAIKEPKGKQEIRYAREGQGKYRDQLLAQCHYCPITMVSDERLLIASHIKPWAASTDKEKVDPFNGYMLSPLYDKLFDRGFITFTANRHMILSEYISKHTWDLLGVKNNAFIQALPIDEKRKEYLKFHHQSVFKGSIDEE